MVFFFLQIVRPMLETSAKQGDAIKSGTIIRLQHMRTRKWLHSHLHASPLSSNQEVCFSLFIVLSRVSQTIQCLSYFSCASNGSQLRFACTLSIVSDYLLELAI